MAQNKTKPTDVSVDEFIAGVRDERRRSEAVVLRGLMERVSGQPATMWGPTIIGFGTYCYQTRSGQTEEYFVVGFSPRTPALSLYGLGNAYAPEEHPLLDSLGPHTMGKGCLYIKKLGAIDLGVLEAMIRIALEGSSAPS